MDKGALIGRGRTAEIFAWGDNQVLKLFLEEFSGDAGHELRVTQAAHDVSTLVPATECLVEIDGRYGIIFERITGPSMLEDLQSRPWKLVRYARMMAELHAEIHSHEAASLPSLRKGLDRVIREHADDLPASLRQAVFDTLHQLPDGNSVLHGDFHPDNIIMSPRGPIIIDWQTAKRGDPLADVARTCLLLEIGAPLPSRTKISWVLNLERRWVYSVYLKRYRQLRSHSEQELAAWQVPIAAARLTSEPISEEREQLLAFIDECIRHLSKS